LHIFIDIKKSEVSVRVIELKKKNLLSREGEGEEVVIGFGGAVCR